MDMEEMVFSYHVLSNQLHLAKALRRKYPRLTKIFKVKSNKQIMAELELLLDQFDFTYNYQGVFQIWEPNKS
jgi:hypothetical protein